MLRLASLFLRLAESNEKPGTAFLPQISQYAWCDYEVPGMILFRDS
jgi:hypothetical protein